MKKLLKSKKRGSAIPLAVLVVLILLAMGTGLLRMGLNSRVFSIRSASDIAARCAADAGLTKALFEMNEKLKVKPWNDSSLPQAIDVKLPYSNEVCSYRVTGDLGSGYIIQSLGKSGNSTRGVSATIRLKSAFESAILTKNHLVLKSNTVVKGYNSLDPADTDIEIDVGSQSNANDSVVLNRGVVVNGDVFVATGADLDEAITGAGTITGDMYTRPPVPLPPVIAPVLDPKPAIEVRGENVTIGPADSGTYPEIYLRQLVTKGKGGTITPSVLEVIGGDVVLYMTGDIQLENSCEIIVKSGATLTIYTDGNIHSRNGSSISTENPPEAGNTLEIYATGQDKQYFDIKAKSEFTGVIYAPDDDVVLYAKGDAYGSIVANSFSYMAGGNYYYDEALSKVTVDDEAVQFVVNRWYEGKLNLSISDIKAIPIPVKESVSVQ